MNRSYVQPNHAPRGAGGRGEQTRQALLRAAAELIGEVGWGRVTTRAIAERARLPLGTVSYHFRGKQQLLTHAALTTLEHMFPIDDLEAVETLEDLIALVGGAVSDRATIDPVVVGVMMEAMREAERNPALRERLASLLDGYRQVVVRLVRAGQQEGYIDPDLPPSALATLIAAAGDGLLLHSLLDHELDAAEATAALLALLPKERRP